MASSAVAARCPGLRTLAVVGAVLNLACTAERPFAQDVRCMAMLSGLSACRSANKPKGRGSCCAHLLAMDAFGCFQHAYLRGILPASLSFDPFLRLTCNVVGTQPFPERPSLVCPGHNITDEVIFARRMHYNPLTELVFIRNNITQLIERALQVLPSDLVVNVADVSTYKGPKGISEYLALGMKEANEGILELHHNIIQTLSVDMSPLSMTLQQMLPATVVYLDGRAQQTTLLHMNVTLEYASECEVAAHHLRAVNVSSPEFANLLDLGFSDVSLFSASGLCRRIMVYCAGANQVFSSYDDCFQYWSPMPKVAPVGCPRLRGPSLDCAASHSILAASVPEKHCPHVGPDGGPDVDGVYHCTLEECEVGQNGSWLLYETDRRSAGGIVSGSTASQIFASDQAELHPDIAAHHSSPEAGISSHSCSETVGDAELDYAAEYVFLAELDRWFANHVFWIVISLLIFCWSSGLPGSLRLSCITGTTCEPRKSFLTYLRKLIVKSSAKYPIAFALAGFIILFVLSIPVAYATLETNAQETVRNRNTQTEKDIAKMEATFGSHGSDAFTHAFSVIYTSHEHRDIFSPGLWRDLRTVHESLLEFQDSRGTAYSNVCMKTSPANRSSPCSVFCPLGWIHRVNSPMSTRPEVDSRMLPFFSNAKQIENRTDSAIVSATAVQCLYWLDRSTDGVLQWQRSAKALIQDAVASHPKLEIMDFAPDIFEEEVHAYIMGDTYVFGIAICLSAVVFGLFMIQKSYRHLAVGLTIWACIPLAVSSSLGLMQLTGVPITQACFCCIFVLMGTGIDDIFVLIDAIDRAPATSCWADRLDNALAETCRPLLASSASSILVFLLAAHLHDLQSVRSFTSCMAWAYVMLYFAVHTVVIGLAGALLSGEGPRSEIVVDEAITITITTQRALCGRIKHMSSYTSEYLFKATRRWTAAPAWAHAVVVVVTAVCCSVFVAPIREHLTSNSFLLENWLPSNSDVFDYVDLQAQYWNGGFRGEMFLVLPLALPTLPNTEQVSALRNLSNRMSDSTVFYVEPLTNVLDDFLDWSHTQNMEAHLAFFSETGRAASDTDALDNILSIRHMSTNHTTFSRLMNTFVRQEGFEHHSKYVAFDPGDGRVTHLRISWFAESRQGMSHYEMLAEIQRLRSLVLSVTTVQGFCSQQEEAYLSLQWLARVEADHVMLPHSWPLQSLAMFCTCMVIFMCMGTTSAVAVLAANSYLLVVLLGIMAWAQFAMDPFGLLVVIIVITTGSDYAIHILHFYTRSPSHGESDPEGGDVNDLPVRVSKCVSTMGKCVLSSGICFSTILLCKTGMHRMGFLLLITLCAEMCMCAFVIPSVFIVLSKLKLAICIRKERVPV